MAENNREPPRILTDVGLSMFVDTVKLRAFPEPIIEIPIQDLIWHFDMPVWGKDGTDDWNLTPWEVIRKEKGTNIHQKRTIDSDITHPILITKYKSRYVILDGIHRLVKAYINGAKSIKAKVIPEKYLSMPQYQS